MYFEIGLVFLGILYLVWRRNVGKRTNFPKGPKGLFILGNLHQLGNEPYKTFKKFGETYGNIFSLQLGSLRGIVLNNYKDIREAFSLNSLCGRPLSTDVLKYCGGIPRGVIANSGSSWLEQRRLVLKTLRDLGCGKKSVEPLIHVEVGELLDHFHTLAKEKKPFVSTHIFNICVINVIWSFVNGQRLSRDDQELHETIEAIFTYSSQCPQVSIQMFFPWLDTILSKIPGSYSVVRDEALRKLGAFVEKAITAHEKRLDSDSEADPQDFIDAYLKEIAKTTDSNSTLYGEEGRRNLRICCVDLFIAGSETVSATLSWMFLLLAMHPEIQEKMHQEIQTIVGPSQRPSLEGDRPLMPYTEAVIAEVMRFSAMVPLSICHTATENVTFKGYNIPKGTLILPNLYMASHDERVWGDDPHPQEFKPERFLSEDGKVFVKHEAWMPFSTGKRVCIGMNLAQYQLFLLTTSIFQKFRVGPNLTNLKELKVEYTFSTILFPKPQNMILYERAEEY